MMGVIFWTFLEYQQHRFELHNEHTIPDQITEKNIGSFFAAHHVHHMYSNQEYRIVVPLWHILKVAGGIWALEQYFLGIVFTAGFMSGLILSQVYYDSMHFWFHFGGDFKIKFFQDMKEKHMRHHYRDKHIEYGVTSSFWDHVFDTV